MSFTLVLRSLRPFTPNDFTGQRSYASSGHHTYSPKSSWRFRSPLRRFDSNASSRRPRQGEPQSCNLRGVESFHEPDTGRPSSKHDGFGSFL
jgi:hypothetical protein